MFLDLAYLIRHELRQVGYLRPEVDRLFFVPPADKTAPRNATLGNAYAALAELYHFQAKRTRYQTAFDKSEAPVIDPEPPCSRVAILPLPKTVNVKDQTAGARGRLAALFQEILTPGRASRRRGTRNGSPRQSVAGSGVPVVRSVPTLLAATRDALCRDAPLCPAQIQRWTAKDAAHLRESIAAWLMQQWCERRLV